ncbi:MAG: MaoC family dehydratase [Alphaproteobacteria bacterium]|nr:MaoC family dehydratase [Alphaproteobacteria bacterium]
MDKAKAGNFFEDFRLGQRIVHPVPRTATAGDVALYLALTGSRFPLPCSTPFATSLGYRAAPLDDLLAFHLVFGRTVADISLNALANLGYADCRFLAPVYPGDTIASASEVIGLREASNRESGVVYVRSTGRNGDGAAVIDYVRWVLVAKRDGRAPAPDAMIPTLPAVVDPASLVVPSGITGRRYDTAASGSTHLWDDYAVGERIDHGDGITVEDAEHQMATRLYQNPAKVHLDQHRQKNSKLGRRLIYGGHVISLARALSCNGLANAFAILAINGGRHVAPCVAGDTVYAWSEVLDKATIIGRDDLGLLRLRLVATKDHPCGDFPLKGADGRDRPAVLLDLDYWVLVPRAPA